MRAVSSRADEVRSVGRALSRGCLGLRLLCVEAGHHQLQSGEVTISQVAGCGQLAFPLDTGGRERGVGVSGQAADHLCQGHRADLDAVEDLGDEVVEDLGLDPSQETVPTTATLPVAVLLIDGANAGRPVTREWADEGDRSITSSHWPRTRRKR